MRRTFTLATAIVTGAVAAAGTVGIAVLMASAAPAHVSYQVPRESFPAPVSYTQQDQRARQEQSAEIRSLVRSWCATRAAVPHLAALCREWL